MAHESFENPAIAALMNEHFVCVKVDREERPDLDDIYMAATMAMNHGHGGWPMTVFLTPEQQPFFAGTYFPPEDRHGRPGFPAILRRIAELWRDNRAALERVGGELTDPPARVRRAAARVRVDLEAALARLLGQLTATFDPAWGGFGRAPKFPPATLLRVLLRDPPPVRRRPRAADGPPHAGRHGARRDVRPARRRLLPLLHRRALAGAALREDALRQRAARARLPRGVPGHRRDRSTGRSPPRCSTTSCAR